ncbi:hypothetical protein CHS0354_022682 [Potamilus streckersoni]|uniref:Renin receptor n=1 Tax=Potamilus streckersoni TaxID=2493646 RepID=A0AAE0S760_9BIVA|nr:hypothetical protein CHS0354_022682 [Potamilus streckersoni]
MAVSRRMVPAKMIILSILQYFLGFSFGSKLIVTHAPSYVSFQEQARPLETGDVPKVISHTLGISSQTGLDWNGILQGSVFQRPKANVLVTVVDSTGSLPNKLRKIANFQVSPNEQMPDVSDLMTVMQGVFYDKKPLLLDAALDSNMFNIRSEFDVFRKLPNTVLKMADRLLNQDSLLQTLNTGSLNSSLDQDLSLMGELQMIQDVVNMLTSNPDLLASKTPDLFSFSVTGLQAIYDKDGSQSPKAADASQFVTDFIHKLTEDFRKLYKDNCVIEVLTTVPVQGQIRKVRSLKADITDTPKIITKTDLNLSQDYNYMYPAIFNIALWMMIIMSLSVFAVAYGIWNMDPGRDSIIYRMTTTRLKKD